MKKAYIIAAHKYPEFLYRLITRLDDGNSDFYVHIDQSVDIQVFERLAHLGSKIKFVERAKSAWAAFEQVYSSLNAMKAIVASGEPYEMVHFLSGQDYPIKSNQEMDDFFRNTDKSIFIEYFAIPNFQKWENGGGWRVNNYFLGLGWHRRMLAKATTVGMQYIQKFRRKIPGNMRPYAGSGWFSISLSALKYILNYLDSHPEYERFHKYTFGADELFYLMILLNSPDEEIRSRIENNNLRFIKWKHISSPSPETLTIDDFDSIRNAEALFARKFDPFVDSSILDRIDQELLYLHPADNRIPA